MGTDWGAHSGAAERQVRRRGGGAGAEAAAAAAAAATSAAAAAAAATRVGTPLPPRWAAVSVSAGSRLPVLGPGGWCGDWLAGAGKVPFDWRAPQSGQPRRAP